MRRLAFVPLALVVLVLAAPPARPGEDAAHSAYPDSMLVEALDNGLEVVIEERHALPIVRVHAYMRIGSLFEGEYLGCGLSHYMEHIVSGGSTRRQVVGEDGEPRWVGRTEEENKRLLKSIGNNSNAATYYNFTQYYITTKSEMVETAVDLISDYLQNCQFDPVEVAREQQVVQQELLMHLDDAGRYRARLFTETMFKEHPARVPIIGYRDCIQRITRDDMLRFYDKHYTPQNCVVSIVGDIDKHEALALVERYFGGWKRKALEPYQIPQEPVQTAMRWVEQEHGSTKTCLVVFGVPTIDIRHPDLYALDMLANVLGISASARLPRTFEHDPAREVVATGVGASSLTPSYGAGRFAVGFGTDTVENARALVWEMWDEMTRLKTDLVSREEIDRALKVLEKYYHRGRATVDDRAEELAANLAWLHDPLFSDTYLENIRKVTPEQIREAARTYLLKERLNVTIVTPPQPDAVAEAGEEETVADEVKVIDLPNGLKLLLKRVPGYGMVDAVAAFNGGVIYEDEETNGLFFLMANTFWRGTETRPFPALMQELDTLGMDLGAESHNNVFYYEMHCLASDLAPAFSLFTDTLLRPAIDPTWVERLKMILLTRVLPNLDVQADAILSRLVRETLYDKHPYRMQRFGTPASVASFTADDVRRIYGTFARPNNCVLAIYGDIDVAATEALVREHLGAWEPGEVPSSHVVEEPPLEDDITLELENRQVRTNYRIAWRAFSRQEKEKRYAMSVMGSIMGATGWLHQRLREGDNDYVYSVYGAPYNGDRAGHYYIDTNFQPEDEDVVLAIIDGVVDDMRAGRFTDEELALAKRMILCYDALGKKELKDVCSGDALSELFGEGWDSDKRFYEGVKNVTREDVVAVANAIFDAPALRLLIRPEGFVKERQADASEPADTTPSPAGTQGAEAPSSR